LIWRHCGKCGYRAPFDDTDNCLFCDEFPLTREVDQAELDSLALSSKVESTKEMMKSGLWLWVSGLFLRG
jgi:hypothetical protein